MFKFRKITPNIVVFVILLLSVLLIITYLKTWDTTQFISGKGSIMSRVFVNGGGRFDGEKIVHLDLKGAPFKVSYYSKLFPLLSKLGATGLLIEYEDMFPYSGSLLGSVPAYNAYSLTDIHTILTSAKACNLTVIPLIQTFGHMEFILKLKEFKDLREVSKYPPVICPTHKNTLGLIMDMVDQIVRAHPDMDKLHIGSDEVWHLAECSRCKQFIHANNLTPEQLFLKHVTRVVKNINKRYPKLRVLMWDDHFRTMLVEDLNKSKIGSLVEPVIWKYAVNVEEDLHPQIWELYAKVFPKVWIASAFKGATGSKQYLSNATHYLENHKSWLNIVDNYKSVIKFEGICLTGWQRYDHFAVLCELLPVSLPTLGMCLRLLSGSNNYLIGNSPELYEILHCLEAPISAKCDYYGSDVLDIVVKFHFLVQTLEGIFKSYTVTGWLDNYNIKNEYSNTYNVENTISNLDMLKKGLIEFQVEIYTSMALVYDNYTIKEWYNTYVYPFVQHVDDLRAAKKKLLGKEYWPKRPFL